VKRAFLGKGYNYSIRWVDPRTGAQKSQGCGPDKAYANHLASKKREELLSGEYKGIARISFDDFVEEHLKHLEESLSEGNYAEHDRAIRQFKEACHPKDLTVIDFQMLEAFRSVRIADGASPATVNKGLRTLQAALQRGVKRGYIKEDPFKGNRKALFLSEPEPTPKVLEPAEFTRLLDACSNARWRGICLIAYFAGLRQGEITGLEWDDVDFEQGLLHVRNKEAHLTKSRRNRSVPMSAEVVEALRALQFRQFQSSFVFTNEELAGRKMLNNVCRDFAATVQRAGLVDSQNRPRFTMHDLRRTFVTNLLTTGADPKSVQSLAGHSDVQTTLKHYAAVRAKNLSTAVDRLSKLDEKTG